MTLDQIIKIAVWVAIAILIAFAIKLILTRLGVF